MSLIASFKKEPIAALSLVISILVAVFGSEIFIDWYFGPKVVVVADFKCQGSRLFTPLGIILIHPPGGREG